MGEKTGITWTDHTFNPWWGCTRISPGCDNCYADAWARRTGLKLWDGGPRRFFGQKHWAEPLKWNAAAAAAGERRKAFCGSMCDVFEDAPSAELDVPRERLWELIDQTPWLDWLLLTKRPENMPTLAPSAWAGGWPENVWALATVENQDVAAQRTSALLRIPAKIRGLSLEPLLGRLSRTSLHDAFLSFAVPSPATCVCGHGHGFTRCANYGGVSQNCHIPTCKCSGFRKRLGPDTGIHWLIIGCEKLPGNRPGRHCELAWIRDLVAQGRAAGISVFVKQIEIDGRISADPAAWPEDLRVQEFPT